MIKRIISVSCAAAIMASVLPAASIAAERSSTVEFNVFGSAEKKFTITAENTNAVYDAADMYQESKNNKVVGISSTAGIIGHPVDVELVSGTDDSNAKIEFKFDYMLLSGTNAEELSIAKYNRSRMRMELLDTELQEMGSTVTAYASGEGQYALVDRAKWYEIWKQGQLIIRDPVADSDHFNVIFAIDTSGSMDTTRRNKSKECTFEFMSQLENDDRFTVIGFNDSAETFVRTQTITDDFSVNDYMDDINDGIDSMSGGTSFDAALKRAAEYTTNEKYYNNLVILLSDGESSVSESTLQNLVDDHARVAAIGLETGESGSQTLEDIAKKTKGGYYEATSDNISKIFEEIREENIGVDINNDTDGDNIPDKVETNGIRTRFGQIIVTDPKKNDTDGDGYSDGAEIGELMYDEDVSDLDKEYNLGKYVYYTFCSDPTVAEDTPENSLINKLDGTEHIYNETEADITINKDDVAKISTPAGAEKYMTELLAGMTSEQKLSSLAAAKVALVEEQLVSQVSSLSMGNRSVIIIKDSTISSAIDKCESVQAKLDSIVSGAGIEQRRNIRTFITINVENDEVVEIEKEKLSEDILGVRIVAPYASLRVSTETEGKITFRNEGERKIGVYYGDAVPELEPTESPKKSGRVRGSINIPTATPQPTEKPKKIDASDGQLKSDGTVVLSIKGLEKRNELATVVDDRGTPHISKYNDATGNVEAKLKAAGVYELIENKKDFDDLKGKPKEMREAIRKLTAQEIVNGMAEGVFSPDDKLTRAQFATIMVRMLDALDPDEDGGFADVSKNDWFFGAAGSSKKKGIVNGYEDNTFRGNNVIPKEQILSIESRTLRNEMGYKNPKNGNELLKDFKDKDDISSWALEDIQFAVRENLILRRIDGTFSGLSELSRGDAAIEIQRIFEKWLI